MPGDVTSVAVLCAAGGIGAVARLWCDYALGRLFGLHGVAIAVVNVVGSFIVGFLVGSQQSAASPGDSVAWWEIAIIGACGGFTTFSTAILGVLHAWRGGHRIYAALLLLGTAAACVAAAALGTALTASNVSAHPCLLVA